MDRGLQNHTGRSGREESYDARRLNEALSGGRLGRVLVVDAIASTNSALFEAARAGEPEGLILLAEEQSAGRGRLGRSWVSPRGKSVLMSVLVRASIESGKAGLLNAAAGLAAIDAVRAEIGLSPDLKWPNDIVWEGRKLGGILAEAGTDREGGRFWVVGIGVNINWSPEDFPPDIADLATSLQIAKGNPVDRNSFVVHLVRSLGSVVEELESDSAALLVRYRRALDTLGRRVRAKLPAEEVEGLAEDVDGAGDLIVLTDSGERHRVTAGDVTEVRSI